MAEQIDSVEFEPSKELKRGRLFVEEIEEIDLLDDWTWHPHAETWYIRVALTISSGSTKVPSRTEWFVTCPSTYPWGTINVRPSKSNSIVLTFPHQLHNGYGPTEVPWRNGYICLDVPDFSLPRMGDSAEPYDADTRLEWHLLRALKWLEFAECNSLVQNGDDFELPDFCGTGLANLSFFEVPENLNTWLATKEKLGKVSFSHPFKDTYICVSFKQMDGKVCSEAPFRQKFREKAGTGFWVLLDSIPIIDPWGAPKAWKELRLTLSGDELKRVDATIKRATSAGQGGPAILLVGFPIPDKIGGSPSLVWWQPLMLPEGFKPKHKHHGRSKKQRSQPNNSDWDKYKNKYLADDAEVRWLKAQNWSVDDLTSRGSYLPSLKENSIVVAGAGALGSIFSEMLVRSGVEKTTIIDFDKVAPGNLVRHTALVTDINKWKSEVIGDRLDKSSIHGVAKGIHGSIPRSLGHSDAENATVFVDTTGSDQLLHELALKEWGRDLVFISIWVGYEAKRTYIFTMKSNQFDCDAFDSLTQPWRIKESEENADIVLPREGLGCWHPVFPARYDEMVAAASLASQYLASSFDDISDPSLAVFEQQRTGGFAGYKRVQ